MNWWHTLPERIDPTVFSLGFFSFSWYGVSFFLGASFSLLFLWKVIRRSERLSLSREEFFDLAVVILFGTVVGARIGYALLYNFPFFLNHPMALVSPFDPKTGEWIGIAGMSAHGGILGVFAAIFFFSWRYKKSPWSLLDMTALAAPVAIFFGRIGNFLAGELFGRVTNVPWGMVFLRAGDGLLRHPSPLYEACGEGIVLWLLLCALSKKDMPPGFLFAWALGLYGVIRFFLEFFREPDPQIGFLFGFFTLGQALSLGMILVSLGVGRWLRLQKNAILPHTD